MNATRTFLAVGTLITSIHGETNTLDHDEICTGVNAEGFIDAVKPDQHTCYSVVFPKSGAAIWLTEDEVRDASSYTIGPELQDGEIIGIEFIDEHKPQNLLVQWDPRLSQTYISGESLEDYGVHNLRAQEAARIGVTVQQLQEAVHQHQIAAFNAQIAAAPEQLEREDVATILAALRFYQQKGHGNPDNREDLIHDIATIGGEVISRDDEGLDDLCRRLNSVDAFIGLTKPRPQAPA